MSTGIMTESRSEQQAKAQLESIKEMVQNLTKEGAARFWAADLDREQCAKLLTDEAGIEVYEDEDLDELREAVAVNIGDDTIEPEGFEWDEDDVRRAIDEDPLSVEVRSDWYTPGADKDEQKPAEFCILLCTGGPAVRIIGELDQYGQPDRARLQHQDWGTPWTEYFTHGVDNEALLTYCQQFYFGE